jgi:hypothetical protein
VKVTFVVATLTISPYNLDAMTYRGKHRGRRDQPTARDSLNATISRPLRTSRMSPASTG